jgi:hypothetical protein
LIRTHVADLIDGVHGGRARTRNVQQLTDLDNHVVETLSGPQQTFKRLPHVRGELLLSVAQQLGVTQNCGERRPQVMVGGFLQFSGAFLVDR